MQAVKIAGQFDLGGEPLFARQISKYSRNERFLVDLDNGESVVLQRINPRVFTEPLYLIANAYAVSSYLNAEHNPPLHHVFFPARDDRMFFVDVEGSYWIAYCYIDGEITEQKSAGYAAMLGHAIGEFHRSLTDFPVEQLSATIPNFHNTPKYFSGFEDALAKAPNNVSGALAGEIGFLRKQFRNSSALLDMDLAARVTHNNAGLHSLLIDAESGVPKGLLNYDTVMPGVIAFDFGDGARSCCCKAKDDETDMAKVKFDLDMFDAYTRGFIGQTKDILEENEPASLALGAVIMTLELGMRLLTHYLAGDADEFAEEYPDQNLNRARVLLYLCMQMQEKYSDMCEIVKNAFIQ